MRRQPFILLSFSSSKKARKAQETQSYQRIQCIGHMDFKGLSNAVTNTHPLLPSMGTTRQKSSCRNRLQNGPHSLLRMKVGTHSPLPTGSHTAAYTPKQGPSGQGRYHYPRRIPHVHEHPRAGCQNGKLCRFWVLAGCTPEGRRKPAGQRCAYAYRCPAGVAAPLGCVIFLFLSKLWLVCPALRAFCACEAGAVSLPSDCFTRFGNPAWPGVRTAYFAALGSWPGGALEERRKPSGQRCAYAGRCPEASRPRWAA